MMKRLAIVTTHPIQYYAPIFRLLAENKNVQLKVFYTWGESFQKTNDPGFGKIIEWDIPLLEGYWYEFLINTSKKPGSKHYSGIINPEIILRLNEFNPDSILIFGWAYQSHLRVMRHFKGKIPVWFRGDSTLLNENIGIKGLFKSTLKKIFLKWIYIHVDKAFYVGQNNKFYFKAYGLKTNQLIFAPHAIDNERFSKKYNQEGLKLRAGLSIPESSIVILFAGKLESNKNPFLLLSAFKNLNYNQSCHLIIAGNGDLEEALKLEGQSDNIHFLNFQNQSYMPVLYQSCDIFCLPSQSESWGLAINEAMACGKAIVASDKVGSAIDLVKPGENGYIFKSGNLKDLQEKLEHLITSKSLLHEYGLRSSEIISDWNFYRIASVIEQTLKNEPAR
ncbi:glycosyltransferase family 4 protein [Daejeonella oryzae]|uniref:glycosyltransferase family 4 protein n=1 Tax=Daejeonella oryzae TaxID=1122943 RepID=UPI0003F9308D|nr:glycosyltransferase family 4 protein [Daejeonella oryzae]